MNAILGAPRRTCRPVSCAPRLAAMNARLVIQTGTDRPERRKSPLVDIFFRSIHPMLEHKGEIDGETWCNPTGASFKRKSLSNSPKFQCGTPSLSTASVPGSTFCAICSSAPGGAGNARAPYTRLCASPLAAPPWLVRRPGKESYGLGATEWCSKPCSRK